MSFEAEKYLRNGLAIEMSGRVGSIALSRDGDVVGSAEFAHGLQNAARVLPIIDRLCREQNWSPRDIHEIYISIGPGSFTGLRIAVTLAKTMSYATGAKLVAIPSTLVLAHNAPQDAENVAVILDAKRGMIFAARYERVGGKWLERISPQLTDVTKILNSAPRPLHLIGEGIPFHREAIDIIVASQSPATIFLTSEADWRASAAILADLGSRAAKGNQFADPQQLAPLYLRLPEAEEKRLRAISEITPDAS